MFRTKSPSFYFIDCHDRLVNPVPQEINLNFKQFIYPSNNNEETCLYINKNKLTKELGNKLKLVEKYSFKLSE